MDEPLEVIVGELLQKNRLWLATAESCTGGLVGHLVTNVPGSSNYYRGGVVSYANEAKISLLGISLETLKKYGAVSEQTVLEMARGVRKVLQADIGVSVSGIAGPSGGTPEKPVGTVWIGISAANSEYARHFLWSGDRIAIKEKSAHAALELLARYLEIDEDGGD